MRPRISAVAVGVPILALTLLVIGSRIFSPPIEEPPTPTSSEPIAQKRVMRDRSTANDPVTFKLGATSFRAPTEVVGHQVAYQGQEVDFVTLGVFYPDFNGYSQADAPKRSHSIHITMRANASEQTFETQIAAAAQDIVDKRYPESRFERSFDEQLGLVVIRDRGSDRISGYSRPDDYESPIDVLYPLISCPGNQPAYCDGRGYLPPNITVKYRFSVDLLPKWMSIDSGVFEAIEGFRFEGN